MINRSKTKKFISYIVVIFLLGIVLSPIIYIFVSSFKPLMELIRPGTGFFPQEATLRNFTTLLFARTPGRDFLAFFLNSFRVSLGTVLLTVLVATVGAYGLARHRYRGRDTLARSMLFTYVFPTTLVLVPIHTIFLRIGLLNTHLGLIIVYTALAAPFCTWLLVSFFKSIPKSLEEAAAIDGASKVGVFWRITLPLAAPGIATVAVFAFVTAWGEFLFASMLLAGSRLRTLPIGLAMLTAEQYIEWGPLLAGSVLVILPVTLLFVPIAKYFIRGFTAGAVKQ